jgi:intracellular sulfur oxidation DsrE/DsrF family protein
MLVIDSRQYLRLQKSNHLDSGSSKPIGLDVRHRIKAVYQIKTDEQKKNVGTGLYYVKKLLDAYDQLGIAANGRDIHAVFHGDAGYWMLRDAAFEKAGYGHVNPNKAIIAELLDKGARLELCASTMRQHGWQPADVLDGIVIVVGAYPRLIDLQLQGYAYIRF